jgi:hypothetical protein
MNYYYVKLVPLSAFQNSQKKKKKVDSADIDKYINVITTQINVSTIQKIYSKILVVKFISQNFKKCINCSQKKSHT